MNTRIAAFLLVVVLSVSDTLGAREASGADEQHSESSSRADLSYSPNDWPEAPDTGAMLKKLVFGTATVLALCVVTMVAGRRWLRGAPPRTAKTGKLRLIESVSLGNRCSVYLLRVGDLQILAGTDSSGMKSLVPLPPSFEQAIAEVRSPEFAVEDHSHAGEILAA